MVNLTPQKCTSLNCTVTMGHASLHKTTSQPDLDLSLPLPPQPQDLMDYPLQALFIPALLCVSITSLSFSVESKYCILVVLSCGKALLEIKETPVITVAEPCIFSTLKNRWAAWEQQLRFSCRPRVSSHKPLRVGLLHGPCPSKSTPPVLSLSFHLPFLSPHCFQAAQPLPLL